MTVSTAPTPLSYSGNGSTTAFPVTWKYNAKSHVVATLRSSSGTETVWALTTNYTLTDPGDSGTLTAVVAPATGETLVITLEPPNTQSSDLPIGGDFPSTTVEDGLDLSAQRDAKIEALFSRCLRVPKTDTQSDSELQLPIDSVRASKFLSFDSNGAPIAAAGTSANLGPVSTFVNTLLDDTTGGAFVETIRGDLSELASAPADDDELLLRDTSATTFKRNTVANFIKSILDSARTFTANLIFSGTATMSGKSLWLAEGANVASASDCNIWTTDGNTLHLTGTNPVLDWGTAPQAGAEKWLIADAATPLTYHATTNDMNTRGKDFTLTIGDVVHVYARSTSSYKVTIWRYNPAMGYQLQTEVATTSGTSVTLTSSIPPWATEIDVFLDGVSTNGTSVVLLRLGDAGGVEATGYTCFAWRYDAGISGASFTTGFAFASVTAASDTLYAVGKLTLQNSTDFTWGFTGGASRGTDLGGAGYGMKATSAITTSVFLTTVNGTDGFDAGAASLAWR